MIAQQPNLLILRRITICYIIIYIYVISLIINTLYMLFKVRRQAQDAFFGEILRKEAYITYFKYRKILICGYISDII